MKACWQIQTTALTALRYEAARVRVGCALPVALPMVPMVMGKSISTAAKGTQDFAHDPGGSDG